MPLSYRSCTSSEDYEAISDLEILIWKMSERQSISPDVLHVLTHTGGHVLGAFDGDTLVGFTIAFATRDPDRLWSHIAAVHPEYQSQGIGYELKHKQREWAMAQGFKRMSWTFDPLQRRNAYFNFHLLGAECRHYHENFYGEMSDGLNIGLPSDRFEVSWAFAETPRHTLPEQAPRLLESVKNSPQIGKQVQGAEWLSAEIPYDIAAVKAQNIALALEWRLAMREVFGTAFAQGYKVVDFINDSETQLASYWLKMS
jgi:chorismate synthase